MTMRSMLIKANRDAIESKQTIAMIEREMRTNGETDERLHAIAMEFRALIEATMLALEATESDAKAEQLEIDLARYEAQQHSYIERMHDYRVAA